MYYTVQGGDEIGQRYYKKFIVELLAIGGTDIFVHAEHSLRKMSENCLSNSDLYAVSPHGYIQVAARVMNAR